VAEGWTRMAKVESEAIDEIVYDEATSVLSVHFIEGFWYRYFAVPTRIHEAFLAAESKGRFFREQIRDRYPYKRGR
jgi:hypothetical protein